MLIYVWKRTNDTIDDDYLKVAVIDYATSVIWVSRYSFLHEMITKQ